VSRTRYYPYGQGWTQDAGTSPPTDRLFTGQRHYGAKSGIYYYGSRFYSADIGRFLQPDTIVPGAKNPQALNRYSYVENDPLAYLDPSGHARKGVGGCPLRGCQPNHPPPDPPTPPSPPAAPPAPAAPAPSQPQIGPREGTDINSDWVQAHWTGECSSQDFGCSGDFEVSGCQVRIDAGPRGAGPVGGEFGGGTDCSLSTEHFFWAKLEGFYANSTLDVRVLVCNSPSADAWCHPADSPPWAATLSARTGENTALDSWPIRWVGLDAESAPPSFEGEFELDLRPETIVITFNPPGVGSSSSIIYFVNERETHVIQGAPSIIR